MNIQFVDLKRQYKAYKKEIDGQIRDVISSSAFIMGKKIEELEQKLAAFTKTKYAAGCSSGTDALVLALAALELRPGDEVITTPFSFIATSEAIAIFKAKPVFVDIDAHTFNIDPAKIPAVITDKTRGIIAVDLFGQCADYDAINAVARDHKLFVIEDAAQSFGASYKGRPACSLAPVACTSFFPAKPLGCFGDGGMIFTDDEKLYTVIKSLRAHGMGTDKYNHVRIGFNARLDTLQAGILLAKFRHMRDEIKRRNAAARYYTKYLSGCVTTPVVLEHNVSVFAQYSILVKDRDALQQHLKNKAVPTAVHYPQPLHTQTAFFYLGYKKGDFPVAEQTCGSILALPMHAHLKKGEQDHIIKTVKSFYGH